MFRNQGSGINASRALGLALMLSVAAFSVASSPVGADGWRAVPLFGGDVRSLAFDPAVPKRVLAGTSSGQVYESNDLGSTWQPAGARVALPGWVVSDLQFDPHRRGRVWAALWALWGTDGTVVVSDDGGRTWSERSDGLPSSQIYALALTPDRRDGIYAATRSGVWISEDAGLSWRHSTAGETRIGKVTSLLIDPYDPDIVYAGTWRRAYRSDDRGVSWRGIFEGMVLDSEVFSLRPGPGGEGDLWASTCGWVYHGRDRGRRWQRHTNGLDERRTPSFEVLPNGRLLAGTVAGVYGSDDRGARWRRRSPPIAVAAIAVHPRRPDIVLVGSEGSGVWRSTDGGVSFQASATGMVSLRVTDVVDGPAGLAWSVRNTEHSDGVHELPHRGAAAPGGENLPKVLDLEVDGGVVFAATESGLWKKTDEAWGRIEELGDSRVERVAAASGWVVATTPNEVVSLQDGVVHRAGLTGSVRGVVAWAGAAWLAEGGRLWRWDLVRKVPIPMPGDVSAVNVFGNSLVVDTTAGRFRRVTNEEWRPLNVTAARVLPTNDDELPMLGLWRSGRATLHDEAGRPYSELRLPVPPRDVSAALLRAGRLHLATAGHGLLWSNVLELADESRSAVAAAPVSSR